MGVLVTAAAYDALCDALLCRPQEGVFYLGDGRGIYQGYILRWRALVPRDGWSAAYICWN